MLLKLRFFITVGNDNQYFKYLKRMRKNTFDSFVHFNEISGLNLQQF